MKRKPYHPIILKKHVKGCYAIKNVKADFWNTPWAYLEKVEYRDSIGRKTENGHARWWLIKCNCTDCDASILVNELSILVSLPHGG